MSEYRVEKQRSEAELTLATGAVVTGFFFVSASSALRAGPERVADLLNGESGFFPFLIDDGSTALFNREHVVMIRQPRASAEAQSVAGYDVARRRHVSMLLSTGQWIGGTVSIYKPAGRDRLSDYVRSAEIFRYVETEDGTLIVNLAHVVELRDLTAS
jgi:hypothetical protein